MAWYAGPVEAHTQIVRLERSAIQNLAVPFQLTFRDHDSKLLGSANATFTGGVRPIGACPHANRSAHGRSE